MVRESLMFETDEDDVAAAFVAKARFERGSTGLPSAKRENAPVLQTTAVAVVTRR
jgi:hypothetical protein